jgi:hypothetical protein
VEKVIERFFPQFLLFFAPNLYKDVDFSQPFTFLDKEMLQLSKKGLKRSKFVDKLVKIRLKDGSEQWLLVHIEVQGDEDEGFSLRMFRYFYRIFDRYGKPIVSMAVVTGPANWKPTRKYELKFYDSGVEFQYLMSTLMDYEREKLLANDNPMAIVVLAAQDSERLRRRHQARYDVKWHLIRMLYQRNYTRQEIIDLFDFIEWVLQLSNKDEERLCEEINKLEEGNQMPYITSVERIGIQKGLQQGLQQGALEESQQLIIETLDERFGAVPSFISDAILQIRDRNQLRTLHRRAIRSTSIEEFRQKLNNN